MPAKLHPKAAEANASHKILVFRVSGQKLAQSRNFPTTTTTAILSFCVLLITLCRFLTTSDRLNPELFAVLAPKLVFFP
jgi:hypothetical protein